MRIIIEQVGGGGKWRHERLMHCVRFYAHRLMSKERCKSLLITIQLVAGSTNFGNPSTRAHVRPSNKSRGNKSQHPKKFIICMRRDDPWSWTVEWLAHEMVHVMQFASGKLQQKMAGANWLESWMGGPWHRGDRIEYKRRPWEAEALSKQKALKDEFFKVEQTNWVH